MGCCHGDRKVETHDKLLDCIRHGKLESVQEICEKWSEDTDIYELDPTRALETAVLYDRTAMVGYILNKFHLYVDTGTVKRALSHCKKMCSKSCSKVEGKRITSCCNHYDTTKLLLEHLPSRKLPARYLLQDYGTFRAGTLFQPLSFQDSSARRISVEESIRKLQELRRNISSSSTIKRTLRQMNSWREAVRKSLEQMSSQGEAARKS